MSSNFELKLADFGLGNTTAEENDVLQTECGTRSYMAPEILEHKGYNGADVDVWSAGVVLFIMMIGSPPFDVAARSDWWFNACSLNRYDRFWAAHLRSAAHMEKCVEAQDFLNKIFVPNPKRRMTIDEMQQHTWFNGPTLDAAALKEVMHERFLKIQSTKRTEVAVLQRQSGTKRGLGSDRSVDVFSQNTHRSAGKPLPKYEPGLLSSVFGGTSAASYEFYAHNGDDILMRLTKAVLSFDASAKVEVDSDAYAITVALTVAGESFEIDGEVVTSADSRVSFIANVYQVNEDDSEVVVVTLSRSNGPLLAFQKIYLSLRNVFVADIDLAGLKISSEEKSYVQEEEQELSEEIGMI